MSFCTSWVILTVKGGTNSIVEFFGPGANSISCTGKATICNMGAEHGATTSVFPYDERMGDFLRATDRSEIADLAASYAECLAADPEVYANPEKYYDQVIEIDLSKLEPMIAGPHTPDLVRPISQMAKDIKENGYPAGTVLWADWFPAPTPLTRIWGVPPIWPSRPRNWA